MGIIHSVQYFVLYYKPISEQDTLDKYITVGATWMGSEEDGIHVIEDWTGLQKNNTAKSAEDRHQ